MTLIIMQQSKFYKDKIDSITSIANTLKVDKEEKLLLLCSIIFGVDILDVKNKSRQTREVVDARRLYCYMAVEKFNYTQEYLALYFKQNQPRISTYISYVKNNIREGGYMKGKYLELKNILEGDGE